MLKLPIQPSSDQPAQPVLTTTIELMPGMRLRAHDHPGRSRMHSYLEGPVKQIESIGDQYRIVLICDADNLWSGNNSRVGIEITVIYPDPLDKLWEYERLQIVVSPNPKK